MNDRGAVAPRHRFLREGGAAEFPRCATALKPKAESEIILVACSKCDWRAAFERDELIAAHGAHYVMPNLLNYLAAPDRSRVGFQWDRCGVYYVEPIETDSRESPWI